MVKLYRILKRNIIFSQVVSKIKKTISRLKKEEQKYLYAQQLVLLETSKVVLNYS